MRRGTLKSKKQSTGGTIPDFTGHSLTRLFALFKPPQATIDYSMKIYDVVGDRDLYVFFDANNEISESSPLSETTTPTSLVLGDLISGAINIEVVAFYCLISGLELLKDVISGDPYAGYLVMDGELVKDLGKTSVYFPNFAGGFIGNPISEIGGTNNFSSSFKVKIIVSGFGFVFSTNPTSFAGFRYQANTFSGGTDISLLYRNTSNVSFPIGWISTLPLNQPINSFATIQKNGTMSLYKEDVLQDSIAITGNPLNNTKFILGRGYSGQGINGYFQVLFISSKLLSTGEITDINNMYNSYFTE